MGTQGEEQVRGWKDEEESEAVRRLFSEFAQVPDAQGGGCWREAGRWLRWGRVV